VHPHMIADRTAEPVMPLLELEFGRGGIEAPDQDERDREGDQRRIERHPARVAALGHAIAAHQYDEQRTDQRQHQDDKDDRPAHHHPAPPNLTMNQVISAATPISMAKAY